METIQTVVSLHAEAKACHESIIEWRKGKKFYGISKELAAQMKIETAPFVAASESLIEQARAAIEKYQFTFNEEGVSKDLNDFHGDLHNGLKADKKLFECCLINADEYQCRVDAATAISEELYAYTQARSIKAALEVIIEDLEEN
jgi:hypothetical protein